MKIGLVGKPNCGKSTFFKASTLAEVAIAPYPFTTIAKNEGVGFVRVDCVDKEFNVKCNPRFGYCTDGKRFVPVELLDVAGLVPGAHEGKGMGNQFLDELNQADILIHIIDVAGSTNENGQSVTPLSYNPASDIIFLERELDMWYLRLIEKGWERFARSVNQEKPELGKAVAKQLSSLRVTDKLIDDVIEKLGLGQNIMKWSRDVLLKIATELRIVTKPMVIACNKIDIKGAYENFERLRQEFPEYLLVACSADSELALREATKHGLISYIPGDSKFEIVNEEKLINKQKNALNFIKTEVLEKLGSTGAQRVLDIAVFELLKYIAVYPVENENKLSDSQNRILPDIYLMPHNSNALDLAFKLHTDIGNKFNCAIDAKNKKRLGRDYIIKNRDVLKIQK